MAGSVILSGARTPIGKLSGALSGFAATDLGGIAIKEALARGGVSPDQVDAVLMGQVLLAGAGQLTARQAAVAGGLPLSVPATTINKVCLSGLNAIHLADLMISAGRADIVVAGGMESMTNAPYLLPGARAGYRAGDQSVVDSMRAAIAPRPQQHAARKANPLGCLIAAVLVACGLGFSALMAVLGSMGYLN